MQVVADRFELEQEAGAGGMGTVYRARDRQSGATVALKVLARGSGNALSRFAREAELLERLSHPAIVRYIAHGVASGRPWIAMEWLDGEELQARVERAPLSADETIVVMRRVADALALAHEHGVVHRDVKPTNVLLPGGRVEDAKLLDFGIAQWRPLVNAITVAGSVLGTPEYMSPEQARGDSEVTAAADVYSLGCLAYECLAGTPPFVGDHAVAVLAKVLVAEAPPLRRSRPDVPRPLEKLIAAMMRKEASERPRDGHAVLEALASVSADLGDTTSLAPPPAQRLAITPAERRLVAMVMAAGAAPGRIELDATADEQLLNEHMKGVQAIVSPYGAKLAVLVDGTLFYVLGPDRSATDLAARAARSALALRTALPTSRVVLATGRARLDGQLPVGEVIDRAAALLRTSPRSVDRDAVVILDDATRGLLDERFDVVQRGLDVVLREERDTADASRTLLGKPTRCVGRGLELAALDATLDECVEEPTSRVVLVTAAAGMGKSRLRREWLRTVRERHPTAQVLLGRGDPMRAGAPFALLGQALRTAAGIDSTYALEAQRSALVARVAKSVRPAEVLRVAAFLGEVAAIPFEDAGDAPLSAARSDAALMSDQVRRAFEDFLAAESAVHPLLIVLEDLHWGDQPTVQLVDAALRALRDRPVMVVALARNDVHDRFPALWRKREPHEIRLGPLPRRACEELVTEVLGATVDDATVQRVAELAAGNAFYLEELIRAIEGGATDALPATVLACVQARLESLDAELRRVLRAASVLGRTFRTGAVAHLLGEPSTKVDLRGMFAELVQREWLVTGATTERDDGAELAFRHALVREAAYAMLTDEDRALGHRLAADWLEKSGERDAVVIAEHLELGSEHERAIAWWLKAAEQALQAHDLDAAIVRARRGSESATGSTLGELELVEAIALRYGGDNAGAGRKLTAAMATIARGSDGWYRCIREVAVTMPRLGQTPALLALVPELAGGPQSDAPVSGERLLAAATAASQLTLMALHDYAAPLFAFLDAHDADLPPRVVATALRARAVRALMRRDLGTFVELASRSVRAWEALQDLRGVCATRAYETYGLIALGAYEQAAAEIRDTLRLSARFSMADIDEPLRQNLGYALMCLGRLDEALEVETAAAEASHAHGDGRLEGGARIYLARINEKRGLLEDAEREAREAIRLLGQVPTLEPYARTTLARVLLSRGLLAEAAVEAQRAAENLESCGDIEEGESLVRLTLAEALDATGDTDGAAAAIQLAESSLQARAAMITDATWRARFLEAVPENARIVQLVRAAKLLG